MVFSRAHALLCGTLRGMMPGIWGRDHKQRELISNLDVIYDAVRMNMLLCIPVRILSSVLLCMCPYYDISVRILLCMCLCCYVLCCYVSVRILLHTAGKCGARTLSRRPARPRLLQAQASELGRTNIYSSMRTQSVKDKYSSRLLHFCSSKDTYNSSMRTLA